MKVKPTQPARKPAASAEKPKQTSIYFKPATLRRLGHYCVDVGRPMSSVVDEAVSVFLAANGA